MRRQATRRSLRFSQLSLFAACLLAASGCAAPKGNLSGKVTYKGKTVASGNVTAIASDGIARQAKINIDGTFTFEEPMPAGEVKIGVFSPDPRPNPELLKVAGAGQKRGKRQQEDPISPVPTSDPKLWFEIPAIYNDATSSGLTITIGKGDNNKTIELP